MDEIVEELRAALPPIFAGTNIDELTGGAICWATLQNKRSRREIPDQCFAYTGRRVIVRRDLFLDWWKSTISDRQQHSQAA